MANEKSTIKSFVNDILIKCSVFNKINFYLIFDNLDNDGSREIAQKLSKRDSRIKYIYYNKSRNVVETLLYGYSIASKSNSDYILDINGGYRHLPEDLNLFFKQIKYNKYDCIFGSRFIKGGSMVAPSVKRFIYSRGGTLLANFLLGTNLTDMTSGFQLYKNEVIKKLLENNFYSNYHFINTEIKYYCKTYNIIEVPIKYKTPAGSIKLYVLYDSLVSFIKLIIKENFKLSNKKL